MDKLITIASTLAILTISTGQLPNALHHLRIAQIKLLKDSQSSKRGTPVLLKTK